MPPLFELVLPAYNEANGLEALISRARDAALKGGLTKQTFRLIVVNNGSTDATAQMLQQLAEGPLGAWFTTVTVSINQGYGYGVLSGLQATQAPTIGWSHADLQCDPADAIQAYGLVAKSDRRLIVKGIRVGRDWKDKTVSRVFEACSTGLLGMRAYEINAQPKVFDRSLLNLLRDPPKNFAFDLYVMYQALKAGWKVTTIDVNFPPRVHGQSHWATSFLSRYKTIGKMVHYMWQLNRSEGRL